MSNGTESRYRKDFGTLSPISYDTTPTCLPLDKKRLTSRCYDWLKK